MIIIVFKLVISLCELGAILTMISDTNESVTQALKSPIADIEDALQYCSCMEIGDIQCIVTRNKKDYQHSQIAIMTLTELLAYLS